MRVLSRLAIASAIVLGSASFALSQTWQYDQTPEKYLSYGPVAQQKPLRAPSAPLNVADPYTQYDQTLEKYLSYGVKPAR